MKLSFLFPTFITEEGPLPIGARYFLYPNLEFRQIANFLPEPESSYFDERIEKITDEALGDFVFIYTPLEVSPRKIIEIANRLEGKGKKVIIFGPLVSKERNAFPPHLSFIRGSILNIFPQVREDLLKGSLAPIYEAGTDPTYLPYRWDLKISYLNSIHQAINFTLGCFCQKELRSFCPQAIYYGERIKRRGKEEILGEVLNLPYKRVYLLDEDIASDINYYWEIFTSLWQWKKEWVVNASSTILNHPHFLRFLGKVGIRIIYLKEDFLPTEELYSLNQKLAREKRRQVKRIQSERILVGIRMALFLPNASPRGEKEGVNYEPIFRYLSLIDPDFLEIRFFQDKNPVYLTYHPLINQNEPLWLKSQFYSVRSILLRLLKRPRRVGLYTTTFYALPLNLSYRQNFLEGIPFPP